MQNDDSRVRKSRSDEKTPILTAVVGVLEM